MDNAQEIRSRMHELATLRGNRREAADGAGRMLRQAHEHIQQFFLENPEVDPVTDGPLMESEWTQNSREYVLSVTALRRQYAFRLAVDRNDGAAIAYSTTTRFEEDSGFTQAVFGGDVQSLNVENGVVCIRRTSGSESANVPVTQLLGAFADAIRSREENAPAR